jgi:hypothetical protein
LEHGGGSPSRFWYREDNRWVGSFNFNTFDSRHRIIISSSPSNSISLFVKNIDSGNTITRTDSNTISNEPITLGRRFDGNTYGGQIYDSRWDWIVVRKYASTIPTIVFDEEQVAHPTKPVLNTIDGNNCINDDTPTLSWQPSQNAENYRILVDDETDLSDNDEDINVTVDASLTSYEIPGVESLSEGTWYWKVIAVNPQAENASEMGSFIIDQTDPETVDLLSPVDGANSASLTNIFQWNQTTDNIDGSGRSHYQLLVSDDVDFNSLLIDDNTTEIESISKTISEADAGTIYWKVQVWDKAGNNGTWSLTYQLTVFDFDIKVENQDSLDLQLMKGQSRSISLQVVKEYEGNEEKPVDLSYSWIDTAPSGIIIDFSADQVNASHQTTV